MSRAKLLWLALSALWPAVAAAQSVVRSAGPARTALTLYRDPDRPASRAIDTEDMLKGYALVSEVRTIAIPAGAATIRFEGVAGGIIPESAIVSGLPDGVVEKNQDADLLSPGSLLDRSLGARVRIRRTSRAAGVVREEEVVIRTGAEGGVVLQTARGFEALRCSGLPETLVYDALPSGLSAKPTLSVEVRSTRATTATITLSYLASGFDWQADYVATLSSDGKRMDLFAWMTLANGDETSFRDAETQAVAGKIEREEVDEDREQPRGRELRLQCWPSGTTSDVGRDNIPLAVSTTSRGEAFYVGDEGGEEIVVTGSRTAMKATQEELGDLKLYRIPERVTIAAMSRKQVAMIDQSGVAIDLVYRARINPSNERESTPARRVYRAKNRTDAGLGLPLPGGRVTLFTPRVGRPVLIGEGFVEDRAVGEDVEIEAGEAAGVRYEVLPQPAPDDEEDSDSEESRYRLVVTNDQARSVDFEAVLQLYENRTLLPAIKLSTREGRPAWRIRVPANGRATLAYRVRDEADRENPDEED